MLRACLFALLVVAPVSLVAAHEGERKDEMFKTSDGVSVHYITLGQHGSWVVLMHGFGDTAERMWFTTNIAPTLAKNHRILVVEARNHGKSDKPQEGGAGRAEDVIEVMDHLKIDKAHMHGYSMGGGFTGRLLATSPERFITACFGGSGLNETDPELAAKASAKDDELVKAAGADAPAPRAARGGRGARGGGGARGAGATEATGNTAAPAAARGPRPTLDLTKLNIPIITINGEFDRPNSKSSRPAREAKVYKNVVLKGKTHVSAIGVGGPMPPEYIDELVRFIDGNDKK